MRFTKEHAIAYDIHMQNLDSDITTCPICGKNGVWIRHSVKKTIRHLSFIKDEKGRRIRKTIYCEM